MGGFSEKLEELVLETQDMFKSSRGYYGGVVKDAFVEFEGNAYEKLAETTFGELEKNLKTSIDGVQLFLKEVREGDHCERNHCLRNSSNS